MNPYNAYQQNRAAGQTRIDTTLYLFEALLERIEKARACLRKQDRAAAQKHLDACRLGIAALASAVDARAVPLAENLLRLYDFVTRSLADGTEPSLRAAVNVLHTLYEGFLEIRPEAVRLERSGAIVSLDQIRTIQIKA